MEGVSIVTGSEVRFLTAALAVNSRIRESGPAKSEILFVAETGTMKNKLNSGIRKT